MKQVLGSNVLILPFDVEEVTKSGIYMPSQKGKKERFGRVIDKGRGYLLENGTISPLEVNIGDTVVFEPYAGVKVSHEGKEYLVMSEQDILLVV